MKNSNDIYTLQRKKLTDSRGWFLKFIDGNEPNNPFPCEIYITSAREGETKGGHYHKQAQEWFLILKGKALLKVVDIINNEKVEITMSEANPTVIYIPPQKAHQFYNMGSEEFLLLAFTDLKYFPEDTIKFEI